jgi:hypothetical protein
VEVLGKEVGVKSSESLEWQVLKEKIERVNESISAHISLHSTMEMFLSRGLYGRSLSYEQIKAEQEKREEALDRSLKPLEAERDRLQKKFDVIDKRI